ncbi:MAG: DUF2523 family protein [Methylococcales bacterium]|nr:DUF2523 family protein [Methylococcales bacterium]
MTTLFSFLISIAGSLAARVLISLGIGIFSYAALGSLAETVSSSVSGAWNSQAGVLIALLNLAGGGEVLGILIAALISRASLMAIKHLAPI